MKLTVIGPIRSPRHVFCWRAIETTVENWEPPIANTTLEARFEDDGDELKFTLSGPGIEARSATIDVSWIAYADQADRFAQLTARALADFEQAFSSRYA